MTIAYDALTGGCPLLNPTTPTISNLPVGGTYGGGFTATVSTTGDGTRSVTSSTTSVCTTSGLTVNYVGVGTCTLTAHVALGTAFDPADGTPQSFTVGQATPTTPTISNLPVGGTYGGGFTATVSTTGDGTRSVTSSTTSVCTTSGLTVDYVGVGTCTLTAHVAAAGTDYAGTGGVPRAALHRRPGHTDHADNHQPARRRDLRGWLHGATAIPLETHDVRHAHPTTSVCTASGRRQTTSAWGPAR